jgi:hypothetical protein
MGLVSSDEGWWMPDWLLERVEPLLPARPAHPLGCHRPRVPDRTAIPKSRNAKIELASITWNYTTFLNIVFLLIAAALLWRFFTTGGRQMLTMMNKPTRRHDQPGTRPPRHDHASVVTTRHPFEDELTRMGQCAGTVT